MKLKDLMTHDVITVGPDASLKEAARRMIEAGVSGLPVTGSDGALVGIITEAAFVTAEADRRRKKRGGLLRMVYKDVEMPSHERLVGDVMSTDLVLIGPEADHAEAACHATRRDQAHTRRVRGRKSPRSGEPFGRPADIRSLGSGDHQRDQRGHHG